MAVTAALAVSVSTVTATPSAASSTERVDVALEWWDISNLTLTSPEAPVGVENFRAWAITWLAAARAVNRHPSPGPARDYRTAAVAAAVHQSLVTFVPAHRADLNQALAETLRRIPDQRARSHGAVAGRAEARAVIADRQGDGLDNPSVNIPFTPPPPAPGVWQPTPPGFAPGIWAGLPSARPFALNRADQFRPGPPPAPGSKRYRADFREVRDYGAIDSPVRTAEQTTIATFVFAAPPHVFHSAVRVALQELSGSLKRQIELAAVVRIAFVDALIAAWDAKYHYVSWRPVTAIHEAGNDGDPVTSPDPAWAPLHPTPPHPDYVAGHTTTMGAVVEALRAFTGIGPSAPFTLTSPATPDITLTYEFWNQMNQDTIDARVWSGIHTRTADQVGAQVGRQVTQHVLHTSHRLFR